MPPSAFFSCIPTGMRGPTRIFWANLIHFSLKADSYFSTFLRSLEPDAAIAAEAKVSGLLAYALPVGLLEYALPVESSTSESRSSGLRRAPYM